MLLIVLLTLAGLVGLRYTLFAPPEAGATTATERLSPFDRYVTESSTLAAQRALVARADELAAARSAAAQTLTEIERSFVIAETRALAFAELRTAVLTLLDQRGIQSANATEAPSALDTTETPRVQPVSLMLDFETPDEGAAFDAIAALDELATPALRITNLTVRGPGMMSAAQGVKGTQQLRVTATVTAGMLLRAEAGEGSP